MTNKKDFIIVVWDLNLRTYKRYKTLEDAYMAVTRGSNKGHDMSLDIHYTKGGNKE